MANPLDTNYLSENILYRKNLLEDSSTNVNLPKDSSTNTNINDGNWSNKNKEAYIRTIKLLLFAIYIYILLDI